MSLYDIGIYLTRGGVFELVALLLIFIAKIAEVSLTTMRMIYINKGAKIQASVIGFVEVMIWLQVASVVLVGINDNPAKMIVYALGFAAGSYVGLMIEDKIGLGYSRLEIITSPEEGEVLASELRDLGKAVTVTEAKGKDGGKVILSTFVRRKTKGVVLDKIEQLNTQGVVTISEIQKVYGGFGLKK